MYVRVCKLSTLKAGDDILVVRPDKLVYGVHEMTLHRRLGVLRRYSGSLYLFSCGVVDPVFIIPKGSSKYKTDLTNLGV